MIRRIIEYTPRRKQNRIFKKSEDAVIGLPPFIDYFLSIKKTRIVEYSGRVY
jgi:hypothetical protein